MLQNDVDIPWILSRKINLFTLNECFNDLRCTGQNLAQNIKSLCVGVNLHIMDKQGEGTASFLKFDISRFWRILVDMCNFFYYLHLYQNKIPKFPCTTRKRGSKFGVLHPSIERGSDLYKMSFLSNQFHLSKQLKT